MLFIPKKNVKKFQQGGQMSAEEPMPEDLAVASEAPVEEAPASEEAQDPMMMLALGAMQALLTQDCLIAMLVCLALLQLMQQALQAQAAPAANEGEPVFKKGGVLLRRIKK